MSIVFRSFGELTPGTVFEELSSHIEWTKTTEVKTPALDSDNELILGEDGEPIMLVTNAECDGVTRLFSSNKVVAVEI